MVNSQQVSSPPAVQATATPAAPQAAVSLDGMSYNQLKTRQSELQHERQLLADRRSSVAGTYEAATGASREGIGARLAVMDKSMVNIESELASVGQALVNKAQTAQPPPSIIRTGWRGGDVAGMGFMVFFGTILVSSMFFRRMARRRYSMGAGQTASTTPQSNERLDRIEQAVDTIAVEIERISENQRFMTRLMTETQLAGTIAAVRNSAEAAKDAGGAKVG